MPSADNRDPPIPWKSRTPSEARQPTQHPPDSDPRYAAVRDKALDLTQAFVECVGSIRDLRKIERDADVRAVYKVLANAMAGPLSILISNMGEEELTDFTRVYHAALLAHPNAFRVMQAYHEAIMEAGVDDYKEVREAKPRKSDRDAEIVRLRDVERLDWKDVLKRIKQNPAWAPKPGDKPLTVNAIKTAYSRASNGPL